MRFISGTYPLASGQSVMVKNSTTAFLARHSSAVCGAPLVSRNSNRTGAAAESAPHASARIPKSFPIVASDSLYGCRMTWVSQPSDSGVGLSSSPATDSSGRYESAAPRTWNILRPLQLIGQ